MKKRIGYVKLDEDDILEILLEHYLEKFPNKNYQRGILLGEPGKDLRFIGIYGHIDDHEMGRINLRRVDEAVDYNGFHAFVKRQQREGTGLEPKDS